MTHSHCEDPVFPPWPLLLGAPRSLTPLRLGAGLFTLFQNPPRFPHTRHADAGFWPQLKNAPSPVTPPLPCPRHPRTAFPWLLVHPDTHVTEISSLLGQINNRLGSRKAQSFPDRL